MVICLLESPKGGGAHSIADHITGHLLTYLSLKNCFDVVVFFN